MSPLAFSHAEPPQPVWTGTTPDRRPEFIPAPQPTSSTWVLDLLTEGDDA